MGQQVQEILGGLANPGILQLLATRGHLFRQVLCLLFQQVHLFLLSNHEHPGPLGSLVSPEILETLAHPGRHTKVVVLLSCSKTVC